MKIIVKTKDGKEFTISMDSTIKDLEIESVEVVKDELPKNWEELENIEGYSINESCDVVYNTNIGTDFIFPTKEQAQASIVLAQLLQLRDVYRDGWKPDWNNGTEAKYRIELYNSCYDKSIGYIRNTIFAFQTKEIRDKFFENFKDLLEKVKPLFV